MPIIDVEFVIGEGEPRPDADLAPRLADLAAIALAAPAEQTWVRVRFLSAARYAEGGGGPPAGVRPVFISVLLARGPDVGMWSEQARRLSAAVADACGRPQENVHVLLLPDAIGRIAFGGRLVE